jgi:hypothetical protein
MSTATIPARPAGSPRAARRAASARREPRREPRRETCRAGGTTLRVLPDGSLRIPPAALRDAARWAGASGRPGRPVLTVAFAPPRVAPVAPVTPASVRVARLAPSAPLRLLPAPDLVDPVAPADLAGLADPADPAGAGTLVGPRGRAGRPGPTPAARPARLPGPRQASPWVGGRLLPGPAVRLTRRGRLLLTLLATTVLLSGLVVVAGAVRPLSGHGWSLGAVSLHAPSILGAGSRPVSARRVTVRPGDTLWAIAVRAAPRADPRDTVATIEAINHLASSDVEAGTVLRVPAAR